MKKIHNMQAVSKVAQLASTSSTAIRVDDLYSAQP